MKEINLPSGNYLFVKVPDDFVPQRYGALDARNNCIWGKSNGTTYTVPIDEKDFSIPYDNFGTKPQIISTTKDITEEQCIEHFTGNSFLYSTDISGAWEGQLYSCDEDDETLAQTAKKSLQSLIQANGLDINKNYLILKKL